MNPHRKNRSSPGLKGGMSRPVQGGLSVAAVVLIPLLAVGGSESFRAALDFTTGVLSLVSLTASVAWGLIATDRLLLSARHRLLAQAIHRTTAVASLGFLLLHATVKVSLGHTEVIGALIPFGLGVSGSAGLIGFGALAGLLMVIAASTGVARSALAGRGSIAGRWRALHMLAYPAWCSALVHGLYAGRPAATWVTTMYCLALTGVAVAVSVRMLPRPVQDRLAGRLLALIGPGAAQAETGPSRRDLSVSPLPGAADAPAPPPYAPRVEREPVFRRQPSERLSGRSEFPDRSFGAPEPVGPAFSSPDFPNRSLGAPEPTGSTFSGPEFPSRSFSSPEPVAAAFSSPETTEPPFGSPEPAMRPFDIAEPVEPSFGRPREQSPGPDASAPLGDPLATPRPAAGAGISAGYRAVSLGNAGAPTQDIPFAERVPMTEELPVISDEPATRPGYWPTPSPPPPAQSPAPPSYSSPTEPAAGPFQYPPAGEPWSAPAGDRP
ncbi:hypothetical protein [Streptomyces sp. NPDC006368]|uniref:hypothetical protein n=1 Tax=Streptomyces sp. NPDC006368 TaxID=3156760 RepID=UPI0033BF9688